MSIHSFVVDRGQRTRRGLQLQRDAPGVSPRFRPDIPYAVVVVKLEEGTKLLSNLVGIKPSEIRCGMPVEVVFERLSDEVSLPKFRPVR